MSELFDDNDDDKIIIVDDDLIDAEDIIDTHRGKPVMSDARRRLEALMEEKRLQSELEDEWD
ncbi:MAG: PA3496 family putative envelope integrity protein [Gammaproteobacteria bacterium]